MTASVILTAILSLYRPPADIRQCIEHRRDRIAAQADEAAAQHGVPVEILLVVAFLETHIGCDRGEGGGWGAPLHASTPHLAGNAGTSASALALGLSQCRDWPHALRYYRTGRCDREPLIGYTAAEAMRIVERVLGRAATLASGSPGPGP